MQRTRPISLEELKRLGCEPDCLDWLIEWAIKELASRRDATRSAEAILEERIEEWADKIEGQPQSDAAD